MPGSMPGSVSNTSSYIADRDKYKNKKQFTSDLDQNAFMKLMIEQLKNQDPMSPMDNSQFLQQTSMMTMVERLTRMQTLMEESNSSLLNIREYESLVGKTATYDFIRKTDDGEETKESKTGVISGVRMEDGKILFDIGEDKNIPNNTIHGIESKGTSELPVDNTLKYTQMIGYKVTYLDSVTGSDGKTTSEERTGTVKAVSMKNGLVELILDNETKLKPNQIIGLEVTDK